MNLFKRQQVCYFLVDASISMYGSKISIVNNLMHAFVNSDEFAKSDTSEFELKIACLIYSSDCQWTHPEPISIKDFKWNDITCDGGFSGLGVACFELEEKIHSQCAHTPCIPPTIFLISDGEPSDDYMFAMIKLRNNMMFECATKFAFAIGEDANKDVLATFTGDKEKVVSINSSENLYKLVGICSKYVGEVSYVYKYCSPLMIAVQYDAKESVELLLESGVNIDSESCLYGGLGYNEVFTPLMEVTKHNKKELAEILIKYGADVNAKKSSFYHAGQTVLMIAAEHNSKETAELLITHGANVNKKTNWCSYEDCTALMFAAWYNAKETAELLVKHGADVNAVRNDGRTALMFAAWKNAKDIVKLLIAHGADIKVKDKYGCTALDIAASKEYAKETAELLYEYEKKLNN